MKLDRVAPDCDSDEHKKILEYATECLKAGEQNQAQYVDQWVESYQAFKAEAQRKSGTARRRRNKWQSDIRNPYIFEQFMTLLPRLVDPNFKVDLVPEQFGTPRESLRAAEKLIEHNLVRDNWFSKQAALMMQTGLFGIGWVKTTWLYEEKMRTRRTTQAEKFMGAGPFKDVLLRTNDRPTNTVPHPFDVLWPERAITLETADWAIHRYFDSVKNVRKMARRREADGRIVGLYDNTDDVKTGLKKRQDELRHDDAPAAVTGRIGDDEVEMIELYSAENDRLITIANREVCLRDVRSPFWHGQIPLSMAITQPDVQKLVGINETQMLQSLQRMLWMIENQRLDNTRLSMDIVLLIRDTIENPELFRLEPGAKWLVGNPASDIQPLNMPQPQLSSSQDLEMLRGRMQAITGMTYLGGSDPSSMGVDQNTASGLMAIQEESNRRVDFRLQLVRELCYQRVCNQSLALVQQFMDDPVVLPIDGRTKDMLQVTPELIGPRMWAHSRVLSDSLSKTLKGNNANMMMQSVAALMGQPIQTPLGPKNVTPFAVLELAAESIDRDVTDFLADPPPPDPAQMMAAMGAPAASPNPPEGATGDYGTA